MVDQTAKRQAAAKRLVQQMDILMGIMGENAALLRLISDAALTFGDADFTAVPGLAHLDAALVAAVITKCSTLQTWLQNNGQDFQKARP